jgi:hypothetical protein
MTDTPQVEQRHREAAALALGYKDWEDATDYRNTGGQLKALGNMVQAFARFEATHLATLTAERDALREALERLQKAAEPVMKAEIDSGSIREIFIELANASIDARTALRTDAPGR